MKRSTMIAGIIATMMCAGTAGAQSIGIGAGQQGSQNYAVSAAIAKFLSEKLDLDVRVQSYGGAGQTLPLLDAGRLDLVVLPSPDYVAAALGEEPFVGRAMNNLRVLVDMGPSYYGFMVDDDSDLHAVSEAKGRSITYGYTAQPALRLQVDGILAAGGLSIEDMVENNVASVPNGVDDLISGNVEVAFFAIQGGKTREADAQIGIRWLTLENTPENNEAMQQFVPTAYIETVASGAAPGITEPVPMMAYDYLLIASETVPNDLVTQILTLMRDNPEEVAGLNGAFEKFSVERMMPEFDNLTLHPAAEAFYSQNEKPD